MMRGACRLGLLLLVVFVAAASGCGGDEGATPSPRPPDDAEPAEITEGAERPDAPTDVPTTTPETLSASSGRASKALEDTSMVCAEGTETVYFGLPIVSPGFGSQFWFRLDSGPWRSTLWYYTHGIDGWYLENGQWIKMPSDGSASINLVGNGRLVEGWEFRWFPSNGSTRWVDLGSCQTTSFFTGGIVFIPSG